MKHWHMDSGCMVIEPVGEQGSCQPRSSAVFNLQNGGAYPKNSKISASGQEEARRCGM